MYWSEAKMDSSREQQILHTMSVDTDGNHIEYPPDFLFTYAQSSKFRCKLCQKLCLCEIEEDLHDFEQIVLFENGSKPLFKQRDGVWWIYCFECEKFMHIRCILPGKSPQEVNEFAEDFACCSELANQGEFFNDFSKQ